MWERLEPFMRALFWIFVGYWAFLTVLLLVSNPAALVGLKAAPSLPWGKFGIHLTAFTLLGLLASASRWPKGLGWRLIGILATYGIVTETLQLFVPHRTSRMMDGVENVLGLLLGSGIYWLVWRMARSGVMASCKSVISNLMSAIGFDRRAGVGQETTD